MVSKFEKPLHQTQSPKNKNKASIEKILAKATPLATFSFFTGMFLIHVLVSESAISSFINFDLPCLTGLSTVAFSLLAIQYLRRPYISINLNSIELVFIVLLIYIVIQSILKKVAYNETILLISVLALYSIFAKCLNNKKCHHLAVISFTTTSAIILIYYFFDTSLISSKFYPKGLNHLNRGVWMWYFSSTIPFLISSLFYFFKRKSYVITGITFTTIIFSLIQIFTSQIRAAWISVIMGIFLFFLFLGKKNILSRLKSVNLKWKIIVFIISVASISATIINIYQFKRASSEGRVLIYKLSWKMLNDNFLTGLGVGGFSAHYNIQQSDYLHLHGTVIEKYHADNTFYAFNDYLQYAIETGIGGILFSVLLAVLVINNCLKNVNALNNHIYLGSVASMISILVCAMFSYPLQITSLIINFIFFFTLSTIETPKRVHFTIKLKKVYWLPIAILLFFLTIMVNLYDIIYLKSEADWETAAYEALTGNFKDAEKHYEQDCSILSKNGDFLFNYGAELCIAGKFIKGEYILKQAALYKPNYNLYIYLGQCYLYTGQLQKAEKSFQISDHMIPAKLLAKYFLLKLYEQSKDDDKAKAIAIEIVNNKPKVISREVNNYKDYAKQYLITHNFAPTN